MLGWSEAALGEGIDAALEKMTDGLALWERMGAQLFLPYYLGLFAQVLMDNARPREGQQALDSALLKVRDNGERCWEAELLRLRGVLAARFADLIDTGEVRLRPAGSEFAAAVNVARKQKAPLLEIKALTSSLNEFGDRTCAGDSLAALGTALSQLNEGASHPDVAAARVLMPAD